MKRTNTDIWVEVADYYAAKLAEYGETPQGVDWNSEESQVLRFEQLNKVIDASLGFSLNDLGCGYGALFDYLQSRYRSFTYNGCDVSGDMIRAAQNRYANNPMARFAVAAKPAETADYGIASGIFNVRLGRNDSEWRDYLEDTLDGLFNATRLT